MGQLIRICILAFGEDVQVFNTETTIIDLEADSNYSMQKSIYIREQSHRHYYGPQDLQSLLKHPVVPSSLAPRIDKYCTP
jgi:hypothetical protein